MQSADSYTNTPELNKRIRLWAPFLYFFIILLAAIYSFQKPEYNWDMLPYMALIVKTDISNIDSIHQFTYQAAKQNLPAPAYQNLIAPSNLYRKQMSEDPIAFYNQLPFYVVKPMYTAFAYLFYKAGFSLTAATVLPSVLSFLLIAILLFYWLKKYLKIFYASALSLFVMLSPPLLSVARLSTPDALSAIFLFSSFYFILEKSRTIPMLILMIASVFIRLDNIIICIAILSLLAFSKEPFRKISVPKYASLMLLLALCYFFISFSAWQYGWSLFYYNSFAHYISTSPGLHSSFGLKDYLHLMYSSAINGLYHSHIIVLFIIVLLLFINRSQISLNNINPDQLFSLLIVLIIIVRFILYPDISDRSYIPFYLIAAVMLTRKMTGKENFALKKND